MRLEGKVALITGGARGIGRAIALTFAREGADIVVADVNLEIAQKTASEIESLGRKALALEMDVTNYDLVEAGINKILDKMGKVDILVNNAGITKDNLLLRMSQADWDAVINVNLKGTFNCIKAVSRPMVKQRSGRIISIASIIGLMGNPGQANYAASKAGIIALTKTVAKELASRNINANAVAPGFIQTEMTAKLSEEIKQKMLEAIPLGKLGTPEDVANVCLFLASQESSYITGQTITIDGGMVMA
ncbi:MAG: 3-oxoacyl-[acyl-carrier-protein] reductase [Candidatus Omnitrophica bacterium]|nr:3-oxoacyl-[acyl-carrier-protein] reductase [Candidatus Omnitrophota bacterium]MBU4303685.1 3-oxoacyl-[acyl-carrier-protein] reductase [Candidatus Omnitrophota bacterium]MBU4418598.1 3-oxoacyl-[acyl-carrier-protein] reductase [Candidatus Omnitrophota bacterium]MBU4468443.1 3-oxoacyl-[acyl-carrier-protein] reductase [Candidatus Omnitrophota bacterium]MCG2708435.1 3-oxoacyl-[acyl-carrier-protein] reductase [Candidatus Omnitrophota bacterium]